MAENHMISHVCLGVNDFARACDFYAVVLGELGLELKFREDERQWAGWMTPGAPRPLLVINRPHDGRLATVGNGGMVALLADSRRQVTDAYTAALDHGGRCEGPPGLRPQYHANYFGAYFRDPEGNKLCICCHQPS